MATIIKLPVPHTIGEMSKADLEIAMFVSLSISAAKRCGRSTIARKEFMLQLAHSITSTALYHPEMYSVPGKKKG